jgi:hypothetical protein
MIIFVPELLVPVTVRVALVGSRGTVPPPPPPQELIPATRNTASNRKTRCRGFLLTPARTAARIPANTNGRDLNECGIKRAFVVLETVTVKGTDVVVELRLAGFGLTVQLAPPGAPAQAKLTWPVNPPTPFMVTL